jgi:hypothetical protein
VPLGQPEKFKAHIDAKFGKTKEKCSFLASLKHLGLRYKNTGKELKISHIDSDCSYMVLDDGSQWRLNLTFREQQIFWGIGESVMVYAGRGGGWSIELYDIKNLNENDSAIWTFHDYAQE